MKILVVEDEIIIREELCELLEDEGYEVETAGTKNEGVEKICRTKYDLYILDINLPDGNGYDLCRAIRRISNNPVMFLTSNDGEGDIVKGLKMGGDDYIIKPFRMQELQARVMALLRRSLRSNENTHYIYHTGELIIDIEQRELFHNNRQLVISKKEFDLLAAMIKNSGRVIERSILMDVICDDESEAYEDNTLTVYMSRMREKIGTASGNNYFQTIRGVGYRWVEPVERKIAGYL